MMSLKILCTSGKFLGTCAALAMLSRKKPLARHLCAVPVCKMLAGQRGAGEAQSVSVAKRAKLVLHGLPGFCHFLRVRILILHGICQYLICRTYERPSIL